MFTDQKVYEISKNIQSISQIMYIYIYNINTLIATLIFIDYCNAQLKFESPKMQQINAIHDAYIH